jgi:SulP family sulfate permease
VAALLVAALLLLARPGRLAFLADFLSRTVLVGFLTGVGIQVAVGQLGDLLGVRTPGASLPEKVVEAATGLPGTHVAAAAVSVCVIVLVLGLRRVSRRIPGALVAVVAAIVASRVLDLPGRGAAVLGPVPGGLPHPGFPGVSLTDARALIPTAAAMCVVILAQSAATARAYAARYGEQADTGTDLVGLAGANVGATLTGSFVVNGSPTKTQMVDEAGGRSQLARLAAAATVLVVVAALTGSLAALPLAALASVVFLIGVDLVGARSRAAARTNDLDARRRRQDGQPAEKRGGPGPGWRSGGRSGSRAHLSIAASTGDQVGWEGLRSGGASQLRASTRPETARHLPERKAGWW